MLRRNAERNALRTVPSEPSPLIIFFYGNAMSASGTMRVMDSFGIWPYFLDYNCLIVDYVGYGPDRKGRPSAKNIYELSLAAFDYARTLPEVSRIIVGGFSIGTGPAVYLAAHREINGLFLLAPFANVYDLYNNVLPIFHGPLRLFVRHRFLSDRYAREITVPPLLVASRNDEIIPLTSAERLNSSFNRETTFVVLSGAGHNEIFLNQQALDSVRKYLSKL